jgi:Polysaccharide deacetylase
VFNKYLKMNQYSATASLAVVILLLQGCGSTTSLPPNATVGLPAKLPTGFFIPAGAFDKSAQTLKQAPAAATKPITNPPATQPKRFVPEVLLYASPSTRDYFATGGIDTKNNIRIWEVFLRKYNIAFKIISSIEQLESIQPGVLLMPSSVALSEREKQAVIGFRAKGGSVLASWLTGVRNEKGEWRGFDFMANALDATVVGNTEETEDDNFMMPHGDNPITHHLPAGQRIWLERSKEWYPLRLLGRYPAAQIMDWSRTFTSGKPSSTIVFDERAQSSGQISRSVVLGYPEHLWLSADPKLLEAIAHNSLMWLLRQPDAYKAAWPYPYSSSFMMAVEATEVLVDIDLNFAKLMEDAGGRATYFVMSENIAKSADILKKIQAKGHEIAYFGDRFDGFKDQPVETQSKRLDAMRKAIKDAGVIIAPDAGFHAPMDSYDRNTEKLLSERAFGSFMAFKDATDARLPYISSIAAGTGPAGKSMVVLPRTQNGPEESMEEGDPEVGLKNFLDELELSDQMASLSIARVPNQSLLTKTQLAEIFKHLKARRDRMWLTTANQVAEWWREREHVTIRLESGAVLPQLTVTIKGNAPLKHPLMVWINLPESGSNLRLTARGNHGKLPKIVNIDTWRAAVVLDGWTPGEYRWDVFFESPTINNAK